MIIEIASDKQFQWVSKAIFEKKFYLIQGSILAIANLLNAS